MEHYIFYCKLSLLAVLSLITACCMLSRRWYVNLAAFLACLSGETFLAHLFFPGYMLCPAAASFIILFLSRIWDLSRTPAKGNGADPIRLPVRSGIRESRLEFYYHYSNFLVYGGAGSGKTKSIGKWLLSEYMRLGFAGFIYDFKDTDYTRTAYNLIKRHRYPHKFYYVSFDRPERSYRFNPLKVVRDRTELIQLMEDVLLALLPKKEQQNEWVAGGLGILRGVAFRFWDEFPRILYAAAYHGVHHDGFFPAAIHVSSAESCFGNDGRCLSEAEGSEKHRLPIFPPCVIIWQPYHKTRRLLYPFGG